MELKEFFAAHPKIALAFSGGVDSAYLLYAAKQLGAEVRAYYVKTAFQPQFELDDAKRLAEALHADMTVLLVDILSDTRVAANPANRCYFCKKSIFSSILHAASADGFIRVRRIACFNVKLVHIRAVPELILPLNICQLF